MGSVGSLGVVKSQESGVAQKEYAMYKPSEVRNGLILREDADETSGC